ncbi:hypothetical protein JTE90_022937 [Oedothorax gibbosus]|uniref:5'-nucleotidase domain-containing protein 1 n=1 Tax=Oedothorax gibbosus TaxID=931172 RepID=A0AAV6U6I0_9ARAC|nr:hypothetical protein JTE90_022937 [Oedothorax gibbosus]
MDSKRSHSNSRPLVANPTTFSLGDYDCIGFDLDHTLCSYHLRPLYDLIYQALASFLVNKRGYPKNLLEEPLDVSFIQKGLVLDKQRGNILKLDCDYRIVKAAHGTKLMSPSDIERVYGAERIWESSLGIPSLLVEKGFLREPFYVFKDYFVTPGAYICARIVDLLDDRNGKPLESYSFWKDYLNGLHYIYDKNNFSNGGGGFFPQLVKHPERYFIPRSDSVKQWLRSLRQEGKVVFLVTSSNHDSAQFIAEYALGKEWRDFFDLVVTFAKKPGFFRKEDRPFLEVKDGKVIGAVQPSSMGHHTVYTEGNFEGLLEACASLSRKKHPSLLYFGDSLMEDVYAGSKLAGCHTAAIVEEISDDEESGVWGSFFCDRRQHPSLWARVLSEHSRVAVTDLESLVNVGVKERIPCFGSPLSGYYPAKPKVLNS